MKLKFYKREGMEHGAESGEHRAEGEGQRAKRND